MNNKEKFGLVGLIMLALLLTAVVTWVATRDSWRAYAIEHNAAKWRIDAQTGIREFAWLEE